MRDDDVYDEDEVRHLLHTGSESEHENMSTEMGYDADSEETNFDENDKGTVLPAKSNSDVMFCLQSYLGLIIDISLVY